MNVSDARTFRDLVSIHVCSLCLGHGNVNSCGGLQGNEIFFYHKEFNTSVGLLHINLEYWPNSYKSMHDLGQSYEAMDSIKKSIYYSTIYKFIVFLIRKLDITLTFLKYLIYNFIILFLIIYYFLKLQKIKVSFCLINMF